MAKKQRYDAGCLDSLGFLKCEKSAESISNLWPILLQGVGIGLGIFLFMLPLAIQISFAKMKFAQPKATRRGRCQTINASIKACPGVFVHGQNLCYIAQRRSCYILRAGLAREKRLLQARNHLPHPPKAIIAIQHCTGNAAFNYLWHYLQNIKLIKHSWLLCSILSISNGECTCRILKTERWVLLTKTMLRIPHGIYSTQPSGINLQRWTIHSTRITRVL